MRTKTIILTIFVALSCFSAIANASEEVITNDISLSQAKNLVYDNSRELKKYEINTSKAEYQLKQAENDVNNSLDDYNSLSLQYNNLVQQLEAATGDEAKKIKAELESLENEMQSQYEKISSDDGTSAYENNYDDAVSDEDNYKKELDYLVESLYTNILSQEAKLAALNKEYELKQSLSQTEKAKLFLGSTNQYQLDEKLAELTDLNQQIIEQTNRVRTVKGSLNDMMGRDYDAELNPASFEVAKTLEIPDYDQLFSSALQSYDVISQLKRAINESEDDLASEDDYYQYLILGYGIDEKELQLDDERAALKESINNLIADAQGKQENYQLSLTNYHNAEKKYNWDKARFNIGQISKLALLQSELDYLNMQEQNFAAEYDFYLSQRTLELAADGILVK